MNYKKQTQAFITEYCEQGGSAEQAQYILENLLELAVTMYRKGDIKTIQHPDRVELVCQLKKGSRRITV